MIKGLKLGLCLLFWILLGISSVSAFDRVDHKGSANNLPWNNYIPITQGVPDPQKSSQLPAELNIHLALWDNDILKKSVLKADPKKLFNIPVQDPSSLQDSTQAFLKTYGYLFGINNAVKLELVQVEYPQQISSSFSSSTTLPYPREHIGTAIYQQVVTNPLDGKDYPVTGSFIVFGFNKDTANPNGNIVLVKANIYDDNTIQDLTTGDLLTVEEIVKSVKSQMAADYDNPPPVFEEKSVKLVGYPVPTDNNGHRQVIWAYELVFKLSLSPQYHVERLKVIADAESGFILSIENLLLYDNITGHVTGPIYPERPTQEPKLGVPFQDNSIAIKPSSGTEVFGQTNEQGIYSIEATSPKRVRAQLEGPWVKVVNAENGKSISFDRLSGKGYDIDWKEFDTSYKLEQSNVFYHTNIMHDFARQPHIDAPMDFQMPARVNINDSCNAYYDKADQSINFFKQDKDCEASSLFNGIIYHEYTHGITTKLINIYWPYADETGNMNEAVSDYAACSIRDTQNLPDPACQIEFDKNAPAPCFRRCDTDDRYPDNYNREPHSGMQIISGALWDVREKLIAKLGKEIGANYADSLVFGALRLQPISFVDLLDSLILADDDNANITDGSMNLTEICESFNNHGIYSALCEKGVVSKPVADIYLPNYSHTVYGSAFSIGLPLDHWVLEAGKIDPSTDNITWVTLVPDTKKPIKNDRLIVWPPTGLEPGNYILRLTVFDTQNHSAMDQIKLWNSKKINFTISNDLTGKNINSIWIKPRGLSLSFPEQPPFFPRRTNKVHIISFSIPEESDLLVFMQEQGRNGNQYMLYQHIPGGLASTPVELQTSRTMKLASNAEQIINNKQMNVEEVTHYIANGPTVAPATTDNLYISTGLDLLFHDYFIVSSFGASNLEEHKIMKLSAAYLYPFTANVMIDESSLEKHDITIDDTLKYNKYSLGIFNTYTKYTIEKLQSKNTYTVWTQPIPNNPKGETLIFYAHGNRVSHFQRGPIQFDIPEQLLENPAPLENDSHIFKAPFRFVIDPWKNLDGYFVNDSNRRDSGWMIPPFNLTVTQPDGKSVDLNSNSVFWSLHCKDKPCPTGDYSVDWISTDIFKNEKIIEFHGKYHYDETEAVFKPLSSQNNERDPFLSELNHSEESHILFIRGDANDDGEVNISDAIYTLEWLFLGKPPPEVLDSADTDDDGKNDISDPIFLLNALFIKGGPLPPPYPQDGRDPTEDNLVVPESQ